MELTDVEARFLAHVRDGGTAREFAEQVHFSLPWVNKLSLRVRSKLGVQTMREAARKAAVMAEDNGALTGEEREELRKLQARIDRLERELAQARTPSDRREAKEDVRDAEQEFARHARAMGLTPEEAEAAVREKRYREYKDHAARLEKEREDEKTRAELEAKAKRKPVAKKQKDDEPDEPDEEEADEEEAPESSHWADRPLFGGRKA